MTRFLTDGTRVLEILGISLERNHGIMGGNIRTYLMRLVDEPDAKPFAMREHEFTQLVPLEDTADNLALELHRDLDNWAKERPSWMG